MRWRWIIIVSLAAALVALGLWSILVIALFGTARNLAKHNQGWLLCSALIPIVMTMFSGVFVYRHVARRRKLQALITFLLTALLTFGFYLIAARIWIHLSFRPLPIVTHGATSSFRPSPISLCAGFNESITN